MKILIVAVIALVFLFSCGDDRPSTTGVTTSGKVSVSVGDNLCTNPATGGVEYCS